MDKKSPPYFAIFAKYSGLYFCYELKIPNGRDLKFPFLFNFLKALLVAFIGLSNGYGELIGARGGFKATTIAL